MRRPSFVPLSVAAASVLAALVAWQAGTQWWWLILLIPAVLGAMFITGVLATFEDDLPGGFNNPDGQDTPSYVTTVSKIGRAVSVTLLIIVFTFVVAALGYFILKRL